MDRLIALPAEFDAIGVRAENPGPFSLTGTNSWIVGRDPAWLVDPGPALEAHLVAVTAEIDSRGGLAGIALTHDHHDHNESVPQILERFPGTPVAGARGPVDIRLAEGDRFGPLEAIATPGHAPDHLAYISGRLALTGDAVLGEGSVFIAPDPGALSSYLAALERLRRRDLGALAPGHGPVVLDPAAKLSQYIAHRLDRERHLLVALDAGLRTVDELLDAAWPVAPGRRPACLAGRLAKPGLRRRSAARAWPRATARLPARARPSAASRRPRRRCRRSP